MLNREKLGLWKIRPSEKKRIHFSYLINLWRNGNVIGGAQYKMKMWNSSNTRPNAVEQFSCPSGQTFSLPTFKVHKHLD